jgi:hypothetical protein
MIRRISNPIDQSIQNGTLARNSGDIGRWIDGAYGILGRPGGVKDGRQAQDHSADDGVTHDEYLD